MKRLIFLALAILLTSCIVKPKTEGYYDKDCQIESKRMTLTTEQMLPLTPGTHCGGSDCVSQIAAMLSITPVSAIVSGSIVVIGNTVYWLQKVGNCRVSGR